MAGLSIQQFADFVVDTGPTFLSGDNNIINSVSRRSFVLGKFLRGKDSSEILQGGNKIKEILYLNANRTYQQIGAGANVSWTNPQKDVAMDIDWRFGLDHMSFTEQEILLQGGNMSRNGLKTMYKNLKKSKEQRLWESTIDGVESKLWADPSGAAQFAAMEGDAGLQPYSIPVFVHEGTGNNGGFDANWIATEGVNQATYSTNWDNKRATYKADDPSDSADAGNGLFDAFDDISIETGYERPGFKDEYFEPANSYTNEEYGGRINHMLICCSKLGMKQIMRMNRLHNDSLIQAQDAAYPHPRWNGIPFKDVSALDSAALYDNGSSGFVSETAAAKDGARYYFLNCNYLKAVFHSQKYFKMEPVKYPERQVGTAVIPVQCWWNLVCTSRRHQGIVSPVA